MSKDMFDQFYMIQVQAKNLEKKGLESQALKLYLEIIATYVPDSTFPYERCVLLLEKNERFDEAKDVCKQALLKIKEESLPGDPNFFLNRLKKIQEKETPPPREKQKIVLLKNLRKPLFLIPLGLYFLLSVLLSLPAQLSKLVFLLTMGLSFLLAIEIYGRIKEKISIKQPGTVLLLSLLVSAYMASLIPPPDWELFLVFQGFTPSSVVETDPQDGQTPDVTITDTDLENLEQLFDRDLVIQSFDLVESDKTMTLTVFLKPGASLDEAKEATKDLLVTFSTLKGFPTPESPKVGQLYRLYRTSIKVIDSLGQTVLSGDVNRFNERLYW